jgi:hypothetical protein
MAVAAFESLLRHAADDPAEADVHLPIPVRGLWSMIRTSQRNRLVTLGQQAAADALPAIRAAIA